MRLRLYLRTAGDRLREGDLRSLVRKTADLLYSESTSVVVRKDLTSGEPEGNPQARIRPASMADVLDVVGGEPDEVADADELWERRLRRHLASTIGVSRCWVADVPGIGPAFMQYLFTAQDNDVLQSSFAGLFPVLAPDEALTEFLYVVPSARNPGFVVSCLRQVTDEALRRGATSVVSFIDPDNKGALFVSHLAGYQAEAVRRKKRRLHRRSYSIEAWPAGASRGLDDLASAGAESLHL